MVQNSNLSKWVVGSFSKHNATLLKCTAQLVIQIMNMKCANKDVVTFPFRKEWNINNIKISIIVFSRTSVLVSYTLVLTPETNKHNKNTNYQTLTQNPVILQQQQQQQENKCKKQFTCIVMAVVDLHWWLCSIVAKTSVLLQQLQTFISIIHWTPTVVRT